MPLTPPNLDDRTFEQLVEEALRQAQRSCPEWTDLSPGDPGRTLLELFAHLTETMIFRLNRLPRKAYVEFLRLIGVQIRPPAAASVALRFSRETEGDQAIGIPRGTRVTTSRGDGTAEPPIFTTAQTVTLPAGEASVEVTAYHCETIAAELAGVGTGLAGRSIDVARPPIVAPTGDEFDLVVGVEAAPDEATAGAPVIQHGQKAYRIWREVQHFSGSAPEDPVYVADRAIGVITFAPAARMKGAAGETLGATPRALAAIPPAGREIRVWYRRGGGPEGNVAASTLTVLRDPITGVEVTNPQAASGGRAAETLENALIRGPQELHTLNRAVTARDFELAALGNSPAVARARARAMADYWRHAVAGSVQVLLVPYLPPEHRPQERVTVGALESMQTETSRQEIQQALDERRPLGTTCLVSWARYKVVHVSARVVVGRHEDEGAVRQRVLDRLYQTITPLPIAASDTGWPFGQALREYSVYDMVRKEPGVLWADRVRLRVDDAPGSEVTRLTADRYQPQTWYAATGGTLFRSLNDGDGWEVIGQFAEEEIVEVCTHPDRPGWLAVATHLAGDGGSRVYVSQDCGESWMESGDTLYVASIGFDIHDMVWILRDNGPMLLMATERGLYELALTPGVGPVQVLVDRQNQDLAFYAVAASRDLRGQVSVAVAAEGRGGVYLSSRGGQLNTFRHIGLRNEDIRILTVELSGTRSFLWAAAAATGGEAGSGCFRWELRGDEDPPEGWQPFNRGWEAGSCHDLAFLSSGVAAATHRHGVLLLDPGQREPTWQRPDVRCGLPLRDPGRFHPVDTLAARPDRELILSGGVEGVHRSVDGGATYVAVSQTVFDEKVTLPPSWLFCSGEHEIQVVSEDEASRD